MLVGKAEKRQFNKHKIHQVIINSMKNKQGKESRETGGGRGRNFIFRGPGGSGDKESACNVGDLGSIPELGRSPGEGKGCPCQYSGLEN